jgi:hypothetical protein
MKKLLLFIPIIILAVSLIGCAQQQSLVCNKPYIQVGTECCVDENDNRVCDRDETQSAQQQINQPATGIMYYGIDVSPSISEQDLCINYIKLEVVDSYCNDDNSMRIKIKNTGLVPIESIKIYSARTETKSNIRVDEVIDILATQGVATKVSKASIYPYTVFNGKEIYCGTYRGISVDFPPSCSR